MLPIMIHLQSNLKLTWQKLMQISHHKKEQMAV